MSLTLEQEISAIKKYTTLPDLPLDLKNNLNPAFELRPYQIEAFKNLIFYLGNEKIRRKPAQVLFHMATGSGKTLIMAGAIVELYKQGYRNFLFFVNSTNIIEKTRDNFLNALSLKYLFADVLSIGDKKIRINEVENFQVTNDEDINITFSTVQALHSRLNTPRENALTYDDFADKKIVLISDEAHHINVDTKNGKLSNEEKEVIISWEQTVNSIFRMNVENILLEFTATIDLENPGIKAKYSDKIIFEYPLREFRIDGFSKEVKVLQSDVPIMQRALQAIILSQYRRKIFEKYKKNVKPVILFKSKTIAESQSFFEEFKEKIANLKKTDLIPIQNCSDSNLNKCFQYFSANRISLDNLIDELKNDFSENKCIEINSKEESEEKQIAVNTLEDLHNEYRAIFAVDKLNEGWDVLNLFDIVRLYDTRDAKQGKPGKTTIAEAQLIGRGARYCPFQISPTQPKYQRKYDTDLNCELRICEELYYHSAYNPKYIIELNTALQEIGIKAKQSREIQLTLKTEFKESEFFKNESIFLNKVIPFDRSGIMALPGTITESQYQAKLQTGLVKSSLIFEESVQPTLNKKVRDVKLIDFGIPLIRKALSKFEFYHFNNLQAFLPNITSISEFIVSKKYLGNIQVEIDGPENRVISLSPEDKLQIATDILNKISETLQSEKVEYKGTEEFKPHDISKIFKDKTMNIFVNDSGDQEYGIAQSQTLNQDIRIDLSKKDWYVFNDNFGTSEEKYLVKFIDKAYDVLKKQFSEVYLVRNEKHFQLYHFDDGQAIQPDFVLFLKKRDGDDTIHYQVFIEPKGDHLLQHDAWKESFLKSLKKRYKIATLWKSKKYTIWGLPFFNERQRKIEFQSAFSELSQ